MAGEIAGEGDLWKRLHAVGGGGRIILGKLQLGTVAEAKKLAPRKTANLSRSIRPGFLSDREAFVRAEAGYAAYVEKGTRPHEIRARKGRALRFPAAGVGTTLGGRVRTGEARALGAGAYVFRSVVHHPGTKPQPFLEPGAKTAVRKAGLAGIVVEIWNEAA